MLDLRRVQFTHRDEDSYSEKDVSVIEDKVNTVAIEFIYKLNDTVFRPILMRWLDWAVRCSGVFSTTISIRKDTSSDFSLQISGTLLRHTKVDRDFLRSTRFGPRCVSPTVNCQCSRIPLSDHAVP